MFKRLALVAWLILCVTVLVITLLALNPSGVANDIGLFFIGCMIVLTLPSGLSVIGLAALLIEVQTRTGVMTIGLINSNYFGFVLLWIPIVLIGYLQWFVLLPWLWRKWKAR